MAESNSYPMLSANNWWNIRKKFKQTIPGTVTASYLSSVLNMQERSATNNIMPYLRQLGIIESHRWGSDTDRRYRKAAVNRAIKAVAANPAAYLADTDGEESKT